MTSLKLNTVANFVGQTWSALIGFILVPIYIRYLGIESYGLLGFFISLQALVAVMDLGLSTTTNREVARSTSGLGSVENLYEVLFSLQYIYIGVGVVIAVTFFLSADFIATKWITVNGLSNNLVKQSVLLFGITLGLRWPVAFYSGILRGLEKQLRQNFIMIVISSIRGAGSIVLVVYFSRSVLDLLFWQLFCGFLELLIFSVISWRAVPYTSVKKRNFSITALKPILGFTATVALISILAVTIKQLDKVIVSKLLPLEEMGYYTTAFQAFTAIQLVIMPITTAVFPRLSSIINLKDEDQLATIYHKTSKIIAFVTAPVAAIFIFYSRDILIFWTQSEMVGNRAFIALSLMATAAMFNSVMQVSYILQLAAGLQRIALYNNIISCLFFTPLTYYLVLKFGISGGALSWAIYNIIYFSMIPNVTHRYILKGQLKIWILKDTLPFMCASILLFGLSFLLSRGSVCYVKYPLPILTLISYCILFIVFDKDINEQYRGLSRIFTFNKFTNIL